MPDSYSTFSGIQVTSVNSQKTAWDVDAEVNLLIVESKIARGLGEILIKLKDPSCSKLSQAISDPVAYNFLISIIKESNNSTIIRQLGTKHFTLVNNTPELYELLNTAQTKLIYSKDYRTKIDQYLQDPNFQEKRWLEASLYHASLENSSRISKLITNSIAHQHIRDIKDIKTAKVLCNTKDVRYKILMRINELHGKVKW